MILHNKLASPVKIKEIRDRVYWDFHNCSDKHLADHRCVDRWAGSMELLQSRVLSSIEFCPENGHYALPDDVHIQGPWQNVKTEWVNAIVTGRDLPNTPFTLHACCVGFTPSLSSDFTRRFEYSS